METSGGSSNTNWKEIGITAGIVLIAGFIATIGALYAHETLKKMTVKKSSSKETDPKKA